MTLRDRLKDLFHSTPRKGSSWAHVPRTPRPCHQEVTVGGHLHRCTTMGEHWQHTCAGKMDGKRCGFRWAQ